MSKKVAAKESSNSKKLSIQVGICKRMVKEVSSYEKEVIQNEAKVQKMRDDNKDEYDIRKQEEVLQESYMMIPDSKSRLEQTIEDLSALLDEIGEDSSVDLALRTEAKALEYRSLFYAIRAFNIEIATIKDVIPRNTLHAGRYRFQYWRDSLQSLTQNSSSSILDKQNPVLNALRSYVPKYNLSVRLLERSLEARYRDLTTGQHQTMDALETEVEYSHSSLHYLLLQAMEVSDEDSQFASSHMGVCGGIVTLLRAIPHHSANGEVILPADLMMKHTLHRSVVLKGPKSEEEKKALQDTVQDLASQAWAHLSKVEKLSASARSQHPRARSVFLPTVSYAHYLKTLQQADFDPFAAAPRLLDSSANLKLQFKLLYTKLSGDFSI
eukprot:gene24672-33143_t